MIEKVNTHSDLKFPLTCYRLRFECEAIESVNLGGLHAGSNLRGALLNIMRRATCTGDTRDPIHLAHCPVCWLVSANEHPGQERRGYVLTPPLIKNGVFKAGEIINFHITLFGDAVRFLPYFILAVPEVGREGVGLGRGRFSLNCVYAEQPESPDYLVLKIGENIVHPPPEPITHENLKKKARTIITDLAGKSAKVRIEFITPLRLIIDSQLVKVPDFGIIFTHLLKRLDDLSLQFSSGVPRSIEDCQYWWGLANSIHLVENKTGWVEISSGSVRRGEPTWISGLVGSANYFAPERVLKEIMPWVLWGEIIQVGKDTAKGNGVFRISI